MPTLRQLVRSYQRKMAVDANGFSMRAAESGEVLPMISRTSVETAALLRATRQHDALPSRGDAAPRTKAPPKHARQRRPPTAKKRRRVRGATRSRSPRTTGARARCSACCRRCAACRWRARLSSQDARPGRAAFAVAGDGFGMAASLVRVQRHHALCQVFNVAYLLSSVIVPLAFFGGLRSAPARPRASRGSCRSTTRPPSA